MMAVVISEILTEVVLTRPGGPGGGTAAGGTGGDAAAGGLPEDVMDVVVRRATERVLEVLRREWDC
ncbi:MULTISPECIES: hypothetical protein [unclassified Geodermatophilus]|uniref:hypothetical protein n=1 Tax=unclassified Geodermatophilus TaxID=2637632 RepID=UPI003EEA1B93